MEAFIVADCATSAATAEAWMHTLQYAIHIPNSVASSRLGRRTTIASIMFPESSSITVQSVCSSDETDNGTCGCFPGTAVVLVVRDETAPLRDGAELRSKYVPARAVRKPRA